MTRKAQELLGKAFLWFCAAVTVLSLLLVLAYVTFKGAPGVSWKFLTASPEDMGRKGGVFPAIVGTLFLVVLGTAIATPLGVGAGLYLAECVSAKSRLGEVLRFGIETLAAVPSIVFGLFGYALFVKVLKPVTGGTTLLSGALTIALMILPILTRATEEAVRAVPVSYREASLALGATRGQTVFRVVLPAAAPRIGSAIILGVGRIVGETAALLFTLGGSPLVPRSIFEPARTLAMHLYLVVLEVGAMDMGFATAFLLMVITLGLNLAVDAVSRGK